MEWTAKLDSRNRLTIPKVVRDKFDISSSDEFDFAERESKMIMYRKSDGLAFTLLHANQGSIK